MSSTKQAYKLKNQTANDTVNNDKLVSIGFIIICTVFISLGQLFLKFGANKLEFTLQGIFLNLPLIGGIVFYAIGAVLLIYALKRANLSLIYPFVSLSFVWVMLFSYFLLHESLSLLQLLGIPLIILGVSLIGGGR